METTRVSVVLLFVTFFIMKFCIINGYSNVSGIESERQALLKFRRSLTDLSNQLSSWVGEDHCMWRGVSCNQKTGHVVKLNLRNPYSFQTTDRYDDYSRSCLGGELNPSLLELKYLNYLDLSVNNFTGIQIPKFFGSLAKLRYLNLSSAGFEGMVPHHLGNLSSLRYLDLSSSDMSPFYQSLTADNLKWISHLSSLQHLDLSRMYIEEATDWLYAINMLPSLLELHMYNCQLRDIPPLSYVNFTSIVILNLEGNQINSTIPHWLFNLSSLVYLNLVNNAFHGSIPDTIGNMNSLIDLYLNENIELEGVIPRTMSNLCNLRSLSLEGNRFSGEISTLLESSPGCLGKNLEILDLSRNEFSGQIPKSLGQLSKLEVLGISYNSFEGTMSELHFAKLRRLKVLEMSSNSLVLNVSSKWVPPFQLETLDIRSCKLGPQFPPWLKTQRNISILDMSNTSISDTIPNWFQNLSMFIYELDLSRNQIRGKIQKFLKFGSHSMMNWLDLSNNLLSGHIPQNIGNMMPKLSGLSFSGNHMIGSIPMSLCKMEKLYFLDLSKNHLSGKLPQCWNHLMHLKVMDLSNNNLSGHIPSSIGSLYRIGSLHLSNNNFSGEVPSAFKKLDGLKTLDLGENGLSGKIPSWIGESLPWLQILNLRSNIFDGIIPQQLCILTNLQLLDLSNNNLSGIIPQCFGNFSSMQWPIVIAQYYDREHLLVATKGREVEYIDNILQYVISIALASNNLIGGIPEGLTNLKGMHSLDISGNHLTGRIPEKIGNLTSLESLDFSRNHLSGPIPPSMSSLNFLSHLNLSFNNLSGPIPMGNQLQTLDDPSIYVGNPELCGPPLQKSCTRDDLSDVPAPVGGDQSKDENNILWFFTGLGPGFACGFLAFWSILVFKKTWRYSYFQLLENINNKLFL